MNKEELKTIVAQMLRELHTGDCPEPPVKAGEYKPTQPVRGDDGGVIEDTEYGADILLHAMLPQENTAACADALRELTAGRVKPEHTGSIYRAVLLEK